MSRMKRLEQFRLSRREMYERLFSARALCIAGLIMMPALLFNPVTPFRIFQFLFFWFLAWLSGRKSNPLFTVLVVSAIIAFNLFVPHGRVLFSAGVFRITSGALAAGVRRAVTLEGLIMLSRAAIRRDIRVRGFFGELIAESFRIFAAITERKQRITRKNFIADIDRLMIELSRGEENADEKSASGSRETAGAEYTPCGEGSAGSEEIAGGKNTSHDEEGAARPVVLASRTRPAGFIILAAAVIIAWLPWVLR